MGFRRRERESNCVREPIWLNAQGRPYNFPSLGKLLKRSQFGWFCADLLRCNEYERSNPPPDDEQPDSRRDFEYRKSPAHQGGADKGSVRGNLNLLRSSKFGETHTLSPRKKERDASELYPNTRVWLQLGLSRSANKTEPA